MTFLCPTRKELEDKLYLLQPREELGAHEALATVLTLIVPHLWSSGHDVTPLARYAGQAALESAWEELHRFIRLEEQAVSNLKATGDANDPLACEEFLRREAGLKLMRLLHETHIHKDIAIV